MLLGDQKSHSIKNQSDHEPCRRAASRLSSAGSNSGKPAARKNHPQRSSRKHHQLAWAAESADLGGHGEANPSPAPSFLGFSWDEATTDEGAGSGGRRRRRRRGGQIGATDGCCAPRTRTESVRGEMGEAEVGPTDSKLALAGQVWLAREPVWPTG